MAKISKKQRSTLREIDRLSAESRKNQIIGFGSIAVMVVLIVGYNTLTYQLGVVSPDNAVLRGMLYITAMVLAAISGINIMHWQRKKAKIDGYRQSTGISRETLEAWRKGEIE